jgi:hypothetical protein
MEFLTLEFFEGYIKISQLNDPIVEPPKILKNEEGFNLLLATGDYRVVWYENTFVL